MRHGPAPPQSSHIALERSWWLLRHCSATEQLRNLLRVDIIVAKDNAATSHTCTLIGVHLLEQPGKTLVA